MEEEMCLVDSCTTNSILRETKYFQTLTRRFRNVLTIARRDATIVGFGRATITFPNGTQVMIEVALLYPDSTRTLISFRDIRKSRLHVYTHENNKEEFLLITKCSGYGHEVLERIPSIASGLYYTYKLVFKNVDTFITWHSCLGHPRIGMMRKIIGNCIGHDFKDAKFPKSNDFVCTSYAMGKLILLSSPLKINAEPLRFLERIQGDICGPIRPLCGPFRYFMVLIDASTRWSHVCLLSTCNHAFAKFMTHVIRLKVNYPEYRIKGIHMDNAAEFLSRAFNDYCMAQGIEVQHYVSYVHTQNGLAESLIKRIKLIARPLLQGCNLPTSYCGHVVLHAADLVQLCPTAYHTTFPL
jgi:hypothetical protein